MITPRDPVVELPIVPLDEALSMLDQAAAVAGAARADHFMLLGALLAVETTLAALYERVAELEAAVQPPPEDHAHGTGGRVVADANGQVPEDVTAS